MFYLKKTIYFYLVYLKIIFSSWSCFDLEYEATLSKYFLNSFRNPSLSSSMFAVIFVISLNKLANKAKNLSQISEMSKYLQNHLFKVEIRKKLFKIGNDTGTER